MVGLLYSMDSADDHISDPKAYSEAKASELTGPKDETPPPLPDTGIKMVGIDLPAPPPVVGTNYQRRRYLRHRTCQW